MVEKVNANGAHVIAAGRGAARRHAHRAPRATTRSCAGPTYRRLEDSLSLDELLVELRKPEVKAAILAEDDLPPDPHRQYESLADNAPYLLGQRLPARRPARLRAAPPSGRSRGIAAATGRDPFEVFYDHLAAGELLLGAFTNYAQGNEDHLAEMITRPEHRHRALRRRRAREDDLRRVGARRTCSRTGCATAAAARACRSRR